ncbi:hypothetical protein EVG20_g8890 [Dentipellis fragilis]|uniref:Uncharacterized protein n=1 Tax=Dentipellis fragilis TaxID=205917 RepID=A0A4Y9Y2Y5_9AGAM|nr:hypothetical protein EVG20_g8890 [Dentipellis fragilis]
MLHTSADPLVLLYSAHDIPYLIILTLEFRERLVLEGERPEDLDEEEAEELAKRYSRRQLGSNADRYVEPEPELGSDGEEIAEPEVDLSNFLERQKLEDTPAAALVAPPDEDDEDVDHSLAHISAKARLPETQSRKGKVQQIEWDAGLEEMSREKAVAEAHWDLKSRFRAKAAQQKGRPVSRGAASARQDRRQAEKSHTTEAPPLPTEAERPPRNEKGQMEDFLDDLLS